MGYDRIMESDTHEGRPAEDDAIEAAKQMNDPQAPQPGVSDDAPEPDGDEPLPELMQ